MKTTHLILLLGCTVPWCHAGDSPTVPAEAKGIKDCPALGKHERPVDVHHLRPGDIQVVACVGDSISSGVGAINVNTEYLSTDQFKQYRGLSFDMGGDAGAVTIPNFLEHYTHEPLIGPSVGVRDIPLSTDTFFALEATQVPDIDRFNAAIPAASSFNFTQQAEYLIERIGADTELAGTWKLITVFLGINDLSASCLEGYSFDEYEERMAEGVKLLKTHIPYAVINLLGMLHSEEMLDITKKDPTYRKHFKDESIDVQRYECICCHPPPQLLSAISDNNLVSGLPLAGGLLQSQGSSGPTPKQAIAKNVALYDRALRRIAQTQANNDPNATTTVVYQPFNIDISSVPVIAMSNIDGFHPNILGQEFLAKAYWEQLFRTSDQKKQSIEYQEDLAVYCPNDSDLIQTK